MSGPKIIVYNVTPAMEARWRREVRQNLRQMEAQWKQQRQRILSHLSKLQHQADAGGVETIQHAIALIDQRFRELQDSNAIERMMRDVYNEKANIGYISKEIEHLQGEVAAIVSQSHQRERSMQAAVQDLVLQLASAGLEEERARLLHSPSYSNIHQATEALKRARQNQADRAFRDALAELGPSASSQSLSTQSSDPEIERIDQQIIRLELLDESPTSQTLRARLTSLEANTDPKQRRLLLDSLVLEISDAVKRKNEDEKLRAILDQLEARLAVFEAPPESFIHTIRALRQQPLVEPALVELRQRVESWCEQEARRLDGLKVRNLVLGSLRNLGYDVREGMQAGWVEGGSIILQKAGSSEYAVELQDMDGKLRSRVVRFGDPLSTGSEQQRQRDSEMEQQWCDAHTKALSALREQGVDAKIMAKREPGAMPVEVIRTTEDRRASQAIVDPIKKTLGM